MAFFAFSYVWFKIANTSYPPVTIVFFRLVISVSLLTLYLVLSRRFQKIRKGDFKYFFFIALCEPFLYFIFEGYGLTYVSSTVASVVIATIPVFTTIGALIIFRERLSRMNYFGIVLSLGGIMIFMLAGASNLSFNIKGVILMLMAVLCATGYSLILRKLIDHYRPVYIVNVQNIVGVLLFLPVFLIVDRNSIPDLAWDRHAGVAVIQLAVFASCGAFILFGYAIKSIGITRANLFSNLIPILTALFAYFTIGESITIEKYIGIFIMMTGLYLSQINKFGRSRLKSPIAY
jgi:drug/metabolite transporter (DMT)-like permease